MNRQRERLRHRSGDPDQAEKPSEEDEPRITTVRGSQPPRRQRERHVSSSAADSSHSQAELEMRPKDESQSRESAKRGRKSEGRGRPRRQDSHSTNGSHSPEPEIPEIPELSQSQLQVDTNPSPEPEPESEEIESPDERKKVPKPKSKTKLPKSLRGKKEEANSPQMFRKPVELTSDIEDLENMKFVSVKDLPNLPKVEADPQGHFLGMSHKFDKPIGGLQIRVRLLKYPSMTEKVKWPGDLAVVEDRVFSWQEKVFSIWEAEKYSEKRNLKTDLDHEYHKMIQDDSHSVGVYFHSYIDTDFFVLQQRRKTLVRKCAAPHVKSRPSVSGEAQYSMCGDGESIDFSLVDLDTTTTTSRGKTSTSTSTHLSDQEREKLAQKQKLEEERRLKESMRQDALKEKALQKQQEEEQKQLQSWQKKHQETEQRLKKVEDLAEAEEARKLESLSRFSRARRPTSTVSSELSKSLKSKGKKGQDQGDDQDDGEYEELTLTQRRGRKEGVKLPAVAIGGGKPVWQVSIPGRNRFIDRPALENPPKCMYIMASLPDMKRKKREIIVCVIKSYGTFGNVVIKPPFGYRIIEARRNHMYRLSWELHSHSPFPSQGIEGAGKGQRSILPPLIPLHQEKESRQSALFRAPRGMDNYGASGSFEQVSLNELRVFVMGEIVSAKGFESEPLCVHFLVEVPQGWKTSEGPNDLEGTTQSSYTRDDTTAHFSHSFSFQLLYSMDAISQEDDYKRPLILIMVVSIRDSGRVRYEGYGYTSVPSVPGSHSLKIKTWKPKPRCIVEEMQDVFLDATPSLQDVKAVHIPALDGHEPKLANRLGLQTEPSGEVNLRLNVIHQTPSNFKDQASKLDLLEKMSSATILKSVQAVIDAFNRARNRAIIAKGNSIQIQKEPNRI